MVRTIWRYVCLFQKEASLDTLALPAIGFMRILLSYRRPVTVAQIRVGSRTWS